MKIFITKKEMLHFFDPPPEGVEHCFYAYETKPECVPGEKILFYFNHNLIATSKVKCILEIKSFYAVVWNYKDLNNLVFTANPMYGSLFHN